MFPNKVKWTTSLDVAPLESEEKLTKRIQAAKQKFMIESKAHRIQRLSEKIYQRTSMPKRLRVDQTRVKLEPPEAEKPEKLQRALELRRRSSTLSIVSMPELGRRVSQDVHEYLEGRKYSLQSALSRQHTMTDQFLTEFQSNYNPAQNNILMQPK